jgi:peptidyl-prolyl cis-trans isomerase SurA
MLRAIALILLTLTFGAAALPALAKTVATVNGTPISDLELNSRLNLMKLEGKSGTSAALDALVTETLQIQEAKRLGIDVTDAQIDDAFQSVSRNVKMSTDKLKQFLNANGISIDTMRFRLKAAIAWNGVLGVAVKPKVNVSDVELDKEASAKLDADMSFDYILKEVLFIVLDNGSPAKRTAEAAQYRKNFTGCDAAVQLSQSYTDAAVRDIGRRHATQFPDALAQELSKLNVGGITKPRVVDGGVSMLAICSKNSARDLTFIKSQLRQDAGKEQFQAQGEQYLADLKKKAKIVY